MRVLNNFALLAKIEATRNTYANPAAATDGLAIPTIPDVSMDYMHDGKRNGTFGAPIGLAGVGQSGRYGKVNVEAEFAGIGGATPIYDATHVPSAHTLLRGAGYDVAFTSSDAIYTPSPTGTDVSLSLECYYRQLKAELAGAIGELKIDSDAGAIPKAQFAYSGLMPVLPTQTPIPAITYENAQITDPAKAEAALITVGGYVIGKWKSFSFADNRNIGARAMDNTTGLHGGFADGATRDITMQVVIEAEDLANYNAYQIRELATRGAFSLNVGAAAGLRYQITSPKAVLTAVPEQDDNNVAMWSLSYQFFPSALGLWDAVSIVFPHT
jgi:hypothetical protein